MENKKRRLKSFFKRFILYVTGRMIIMRTLAFVSTFEFLQLNKLVDADKISIIPTMAEGISIFNNHQDMPVIIVKSLMNLTYHSEYIVLFETLYALHKLFDLSTAFGLEYSCFCLMKYLFKQVLVWVWNMNGNDWRAILNNPNSIHTTLTLQQIDGLEFEINHFRKEINNANSSRTAITDQERNQKIDALIAHHLSETIPKPFWSTVFEMPNTHRIWEMIKQWCYSVLTAVTD